MKHGGNKLAELNGLVNLLLVDFLRDALDHTGWVERRSEWIQNQRSKLKFQVNKDSSKLKFPVW